MYLAPPISASIEKMPISITVSLSATGDYVTFNLGNYAKPGVSTQVHYCEKGVEILKSFISTASAVLDEFTGIKEQIDSFDNLCEDPYPEPEFNCKPTIEQVMKEWGQR